MKTKEGRCCVWVAAVLVTGLASRVQAEERDLSFFVRQIIDLDRLPLFEPGETSRQFSSYDRASRLGPNGEKINWGANGDAGHYLRKEPSGEAVMAEMEGPGVVTQTWSANPQGKLHFYIDGAEKPIVFDFTEFTTGGIPEIPPPISTKGGGAGANSYLPIPYAKSCVIKADKAHGQYYHFDYTTFAPGTRVKSFSWPLSQAEKEEISWVARRLSERCGDDPMPRRQGTTKITRKVTLSPGSTVLLAEPEGPAVVTAFRAKLEGAGRSLRRSVVLRAFWDGAEKPSIEAPYGDFFSSTWADIPFKSLPIGMTEDGGYSYWRMPFAKKARFEASHDGAGEARLEVELTISSAEWTDRTGYFHAKWRREAPNLTFDWPYLECEGRGRYVGVSMSVQNPDPPWFGEGDEKVYVDGEAFPSWFGTGTEDYFCDAWGFRKFIQFSHGCPIYNEPGKTSVYRWHILDSIPFTKSFEMTIENYGNNKDYSAVAYWYASPPGRDFFKSTTLQERLPWPFRIPGAIELEEIAPPGSSVVDDSSGPFELSGGKAVLLSPSSGELKVEVPVPGMDAYRLVLHGPKGQVGSGLTAILGGRAVLEAPAPAFGSSGEILARMRRVIDRGKVELEIRATGPAPPVLVDALRLEPSRRVQGVIEAEGLKANTSSDAKCEVIYALENEAVSGAACLLLSANRPGEWADVVFPADIRGRYQVAAKVFRGPAGGLYECSAAGSAVGLLDGYAEKDDLGPETSLGVVDFPGGDGNKLRFTAMKKAESSHQPEGSSGLELRLDYIKLVRILVPGAIEAEGLKILRQENANAQHQMLGSQWSADGQLFCPGQENQFVELELPVKEAGQYAIDIYFTKAGDYGIVEVELDGKPLVAKLPGEKFNGYNDGVAPSERVSFGKARLSAGAHKLLFRCRAKDARSSNYFFGVDCLTLTREP